MDHDHGGVHKSPVFYILCGNAAYNRGDRGNLFSQLALLREHFPDGTFVFDSHRAEVDRQWYDAIVLKRSIVPGKEQRQWMRRADIIIWGGGALLADNSCRLLVPYWLIVITYVKWVLRKPVMVWSHGIVLETRLGRLLGRYALNMVDRITVRDKGSFSTCQSLGIRVPCEQTADIAVLLSPGSREEGEALLCTEGIPSGRPLICLSPTFWHFYHDQQTWLPYPMGKRFSFALYRKRRTLERYKQGIAQLARILFERHDAHILLMPRYASPLWDDVAFCHEIADAANLPGTIHILANDHYHPRQFLAIWKCFALNISVALHDAIFASVMDCPAVHLHYEAKGRDFFESLHAPQQLMPWETLLEEGGPACIADRAGEVLAQWQSGRLQRSAAIQSLQVLAMRNVEVIKQLYANIIAINHAPGYALRTDASS